jgi:hypothetical protein
MSGSVDVTRRDLDNRPVETSTVDVTREDQLRDRRAWSAILYQPDSSG